MLAFLDLYEKKKLLEIWYSCSNFVTFATVETKSNKRKKKCTIKNVYIYMSFVQVTLGVTLSNVTPINIF